MQVLNSQKLASSAYRTLGLSGSASQAQIDQAARRMRIWPDPASIPPTEWDLPWLGPLRRGKIDIEQALATLNDPTSRIEERLLWFNDANPQLWASGNIKQIDKAIRALPTPHGPALSHDIALARLQFALLQDPEFRDSDRWGNVLAKLGALADSEPYLAQAMKIEQEGRFEKPARSDEIEEALRALPSQVGRSIAARAESAMEDDDLATATRILSILRLGAPDILAECEGQMAERLENLILRRCDHVHEDIDKVGAPGRKVKRDKALCAAQSKFYAASIEPLVTQLHQVAGAESDRFFRARTEAARAKAHLAQGWAILREFRTALIMLNAALQLGAGTPVERPIRDNLERCQRVLRKQPAGAPGTSAASVKSGQSYIPTYTPATRKKTSGTGKGLGVMIGVMIALGRIVSLFSSSSSSPPNHLPTQSLDNVQFPSALVTPSVTESLDAPGLRFDDGTSRFATYLRRDGFGARLYSLDLTEKPDPRAHAYAVVGQEFHFAMVQRLLQTNKEYSLVEGPVGFQLNRFTGVGTWTPRIDQMDHADVEIEEDPAPGGSHLFLTIPCYRFDHPDDLKVTFADPSPANSGPNPIRQTVVSWSAPAGAQNLAGYRINVINVDQSESKEFIVDGNATSLLLPNLSFGRYQITIAAHDPQNMFGLEASLEFDVPSQSNAP